MPKLLEVLAVTALVWTPARAALLPATNYDPAVPPPAEILGFELGSRAATPEEITSALKSWSATSPRMEVVDYARSHEGRPLSYAVISSPENLGRLAEIQRGMAELSDPRGLSSNEGERLVETLPAVAWLAYSIHGDETSGGDAGLAVIYHLAAARDPEVKSLLDAMVVVVDPMMNPDGRQRFLQQVAEHRGATPSYDDQSLLHTGYWPWGRTNHYLFDLNRDWIFATQPETRGRIAAVGRWHPLLFVDGHEMGSQETYLFSPPRAPLSPHLPAYLHHWGEVFAQEQAEAFDRFGWPYYTGEWNEGWYPGYSDSWAGFRGAVGILYEQAGVADTAVRQQQGRLLTYEEAVHHQLVSTLANLETLRNHARKLREELLADRRRAVSPDGPWASRTFAVLPSAHGARREALVDLLRLQGIEVAETTREVTVNGVADALGRKSERQRLPPGTLIIPNRQPEAHLVAALLDLDPQLPPAYLERERRELLRGGDSTLYDVTAWNPVLLFGLEPLVLSQGLPPDTAPVSREASPSPPTAAGHPVAWIVDGIDDRSVALAGRLLQRGLQLRVADTAFSLEGHDLARGSVVVTSYDNPSAGEKLGEVVGRVAAPLELAAVAVSTGLGAGELPDLGGGHFRLLQRPRVAVLARGGVSSYDFGAIWYFLDRGLGVPSSQLDETRWADFDLRRYNVLVLPDRSGPAEALPERTLEAIGTWVRAGGTLIAIGAAAAQVTTAELGTVRRLPDALDDLPAYRQTVQVEWQLRHGRLPPAEAVWSHAAKGPREGPGRLAPEASSLTLEELQQRDRWQHRFMPRGTILAGRSDPDHWLTVGQGDLVPILYRDDPVLMAKQPAEAPVRLGLLECPARPETGPIEVGWSSVPAGCKLHLRISGLLWPEAAERLANAAYLTRESVGAGQVILFAATPAFRGATRATLRLFANAVVYGPGLGVAPTVPAR